MTLYTGKLYLLAFQFPESSLSEHSKSNLNFKNSNLYSPRCSHYKNTKPVNIHQMYTSFFPSHYFSRKLFPKLKRPKTRKPNHRPFRKRQTCRLRFRQNHKEGQNLHPMRHPWVPRPRDHKRTTPGVLPRRRLVGDRHSNLRNAGGFPSFLR